MLLLAILPAIESRAFADPVPSLPENLEALSEVLSDEFYNKDPHDRLDIVSDYIDQFTDQTPIEIKAVLSGELIDTFLEVEDFIAAIAYAREVHPYQYFKSSNTQANEYLLTKTFYAASKHGDYEFTFEVLSHLQQLQERSNSEHLAFKVDNMMAEALILIGEFERAGNLLSDVYERNREVLHASQKQRLPRLLGNTVYAFNEANRADRALFYLDILDTVLAELDEAGKAHPWQMTQAKLARAHAMHSAGEFEQSKILSTEALKEARQTDERRLQAWALRILGEVAYDSDSIDEALYYYREAESLATQLGDLELIIRLSPKYAKALAKQGGATTAFRVLDRFFEKRNEIEKNRMLGRVALLQLDISRERRASEIDKLLLEKESAKLLRARDERILSLTFGGLLLLGITVLILIAFVIGQRRTRLRLQKYAEELKESEARSFHLANHDTLTGLANRLKLHRRLQSAIESLKVSKVPFAVHIIDLDRFKAVNDTYGHPAGDELICAVSNRILALCQSADTVARLGGDEFAVVQIGAQESLASEFARKIVQHMNERFELTCGEVEIGASVGLAVFDGVAPDISECLRKADLALYQSKESGRGKFSIYEENISAFDQAVREAERPAIKIN